MRSGFAELTLIDPLLKGLCIMTMHGASIITQSYLACGEDTHALRLTSKLVDLRAGYAKRIR